MFPPIVPQRSTRHRQVASIVSIDHWKKHSITSTGQVYISLLGCESSIRSTEMLDNFTTTTTAAYLVRYLFFICYTHAQMDARFR